MALENATPAARFHGSAEEAITVKFDCRSYWQTTKCPGSINRA
ncbi:hypothetical protein ADIARSV_3271 [Arcticibacter svalbardensis MN12-7]|uniref:Uncharacterized protein n=1 Tax=Arcticibacter svalbardensis MN12-7 TaxID=1150600 RepID=R9GPA9_9SPHI|nr:hypothetical protein ADIARSV_3271 [Arcticibacter svalbardensis MN12-7]